MVDSKEFQHRIKELISPDYNLEFLGTKFEDICRQLTYSKAEKNIPLDIKSS